MRKATGRSKQCPVQKKKYTRNEAPTKVKHPLTMETIQLTLPPIAQFPTMPRLLYLNAKILGTL